MPHDGETVRKPARRVTVTSDQDGQRLDNFLLRELNLPRARVYKMIRKGEVRVNRGRVKPMAKLAAGDEVRIPPIQVDACAESEAQHAVPASALQALAESVVYSGEGLRIINKPAGWASQGGSGIRWSVIDAVKAAWGDDWQPAHRLDRATSGCLAITQGRENFNAFNAGPWSKRYIALVHSEFIAGDGVWVDYLRRTPRGDVEVVDESDAGGKFAKSEVCCLTKTPTVSELALCLHTGRTHQIRVQCASRGYPLLGDERYGNHLLDKRVFQRVKQKPRLALHAAQLMGSWKGERVDASAAIPAVFTELLQTAALA